MTTIKKFTNIFLFVLVGLTISASCSVFAETATVTATVPSKASAQYSIVTVNVPEVLADNSQKLLVSVQLKDSEQAPLVNSSVTLTTNRGAVDHADVVTANGSVVKLGYGTGVEGLTGTDGMGYFNVYSQVPGDVEITLKADNVVLLAIKTIKFLPVPFPKNVSVSISIPPIIGNLIPGYNKQQSSLPLFVPDKQQFDDAKIVNLGVNLQIPFWLFIITALLVLAIPLLSTSNIVLLRRIRKDQKTETSEIEAKVEEIHEEITAELDKNEEAPKIPEN